MDLARPVGSGSSVPSLGWGGGTLRSSSMYLRRVLSGAGRLEVYIQRLRFNCLGLPLGVMTLQHFLLGASCAAFLASAKPMTPGMGTPPRLAWA